MTDNQAERTRLARIYSELSDEGLAELAAEAGSLTDLAKSVLDAELAARHIEIQKPETRETNLGEISAAAEEEMPSETLVEGPPGHSGPLVMVKRFRDLPEAFVAKSILDSARIDCFLADENMVRIDWFISNLLGGVKLMVRPEDAQEASALLNEDENEANASKELM